VSCWYITVGTRVPRARQRDEMLKPMNAFERICSEVPWCRHDVLDNTVELSLEIAREGREGRRIGTLFTIGFAQDVLERSRPLILDPLAGHPKSARHISDPNLRGTLKELAQLDGAFVLSDDGTVEAACRYLNIVTRAVEIPLGLGSRHLAAASISKETGAIAIVVSESAIVRVFHSGNIVAGLIPELWLLSKYTPQLRGRVHEEHLRDVAIFTSDSPAETEGKS